MKDVLGISPRTQSWLVQASILMLAAVIAVSIRLFSVIRFESIIHEFDPYFNYRTTKYMTEEGIYDFHNWFDIMAWYPLGRIVGGTIYPGLMWTSSLIHYVMHAIHLSIDIRNICVFLAPCYAGLTTIITFLLTKEIHDAGAGLVAAGLIAIVPGYISRSVAGSYDNEGIAIFCMLFTFYCWVKSIKTGSILWGSICSLAYFYMVSSWGGYVFLINVIPIHVIVLMVSGRFTHKIYVAYTTFYAIGTLLSMQITFVGFLPVFSSEHMGALGVFGLCQIVAFFKYLGSKLTTIQFNKLIQTIFAMIAIILTVPLVILMISGKIAPWTGRFYSLLDPTYAKNNIPIIASVSEHQPTAWGSYFFDLQFLTVMFPVGLYYCFKKPTDSNIFLIMYAVTSVYFSGVMVRLMLVLAPAMCIVGAIAISNLLKSFLPNAKGIMDKPKTGSSSTTVGHTRSGGKASSESTYMFKEEVSTVMICILVLMLILYCQHCIWVTSTSYSHPSIVMESRGARGERVILDDYRAAYFWLRQNTRPDARVMSWWDYGYQITAIANRTVLVDNNTWNNTHIGRVGQAMASNEEEAYAIMQELDVDYVLVIFGGVLGYSGDDINKFIWMVRISGNTEKGKHVNERDYYSRVGEMRVDEQASETMSNCLMYKLSYYRFWEMQTERSQPAGFDRVRKQSIGHRNYTLHGLEEAFTSENWLVRIFRVKPLANRGKI